MNVTVNKVLNLLRSKPQKGYKIASVSYQTVPKVLAKAPKVFSVTTQTVGLGVNYARVKQEAGKGEIVEPNWFESFGDQNYVVRHRTNGKAYLRATGLKTVSRKCYKVTEEGTVEITAEEFNSYLPKRTFDGKPPVKTIPLDNILAFKYAGQVIE